MLYREGRDLSLPPKAVETLLVLVKHCGEIVGKTELIDSIWPDTIVEESNLAQYIHLLRKTLGKTPDGQMYIETFRRRGYRFNGKVTTDIAGLSTRADRRQFPEAYPGEIGQGERARRRRAGFAVVLVGVVLIGILAGVLYLSRPSQPAIPSIAILPFENAAGDSELDYLADGMTDSLINSLSQLPGLAVKARSLVFRYRSHDVKPQQVASELSVQAVLTGRVVQHGDGLTLYLSLIDGQSGDQLWGDKYERKISELVTLQNDIASDVARKLRTRLSGSEEQRLRRNYTDNTEAYRLFLKGRYQILKQKRSETQKGITFFEKAIEIDPSYALAYVGLAEANRALALSGELPSSEYMPKAKAAAQKAIEIDDTLAEAHSALGFILFWYDWDWNEAEKQCKRALELDPNSADSHLVYAHLLSNTGRHEEALAEAKRATELDPLNLRTNALEGEFLIHAGRTDEGLDKLKKVSELDQDYWFAHVFAASGYIEKWDFAAAADEALKARDLSEGNAQPYAFLAYALNRSGKKAEARAVLDELLKRSEERYVPPYYVALALCGLGRPDDAIRWLQRGLAERDPRMTFLKVEPKWDPMRSDPRFQDILRRVGFQQ